MIALLMQVGPWILAGLSAAGALLIHWHAKAKVADAQTQAATQVATAQAEKQVAVDNLNARKTADVQADADASKTAASAAQERTDVENSQTALSDDAARSDLLGLLHGSGADNPGSGQGSAGTDTNR